MTLTVTFDIEISNLDFDASGGIHISQTYLIFISTLLESKSDGIEVSYNAAGIFSHILADGIQVWTIEEPSREETMLRMIGAIEQWPLTSQRNINYR